MEATELQNINFVKFNKVNIFGNRGVGKSSLISFIENYNYKNIILNFMKILSSSS